MMSNSESETSRPRKLVIASRLDLDDVKQSSLDVSANASIRIGAANHRENRKQQHVRQPVQFAFGPTRVADSRKQRKQGFERLQGFKASRLQGFKASRLQGNLRDSVASEY
jgi:hypothetical protein